MSTEPANQASSASVLSLFGARIHCRFIVVCVYELNRRNRLDVRTSVDSGHDPAGCPLWSMRAKEAILSLILLQETSGAGGNGLGTGESRLAIIVTVLVMLGIVALVGVFIWQVVQNPTIPEGSRSWLDYGNLFIVALGILAVLLAFLVAMLFSTALFRDANQVLAVLTALFGVVGTLVGTYFGVKAGSDAVLGAHNLASGTTASAQPTVLSVAPSPGASNIPGNTRVIATFSKAMNPDTLTNLTFTLAERETGAAVPDVEVTYEPLTNQATLNSINDLSAGIAYRATITTGVQDQAGNALTEAFTWDFTVA